MDTRTSVRYASSGHLLYLRDHTLVAQPFDRRTRELSGEPVPLVREMDWTFHFETIVSVSDTGLLLYQPRIQAETCRLTWLDREGQPIGTVGKAADYSTVALSNDERRIATAICDPLTRNSDIWIVDIERGTSARITFESGDDLAPVWGPDGALMAAEVELEPVFSAAPPVRLFHPRERDVVGNRYDVTSDGQRFLVNRPSDPGAVDPWVLVQNWTAELE